MDAAVIPAASGPAAAADGPEPETTHRHAAGLSQPSPPPPPEPRVAPSPSPSSSLAPISGHRLVVPSGSPAESPAAATAAAPCTTSPLVICFHGSGESCSPSWDALATRLAERAGLRVLLFDRGPHNPGVAEATAALRAYLASSSSSSSTGSSPPPPCKDDDTKFLLVAHSYGGAFARAFMQAELARVAGMVLVETGQEGGLAPTVDAAQRRRRVLGARPLCVVRGDSLLAKRAALDRRVQAQAELLHHDAAAVIAAGGGGERGTAMALLQARCVIVAQKGLLDLDAERRVLAACDAEDERLKRAQLRLSRVSRYVRVRDVGHHVVRDRPDEVVAAVEWVLANLPRPPEPGRFRSWWSWAVSKASWSFRR
ncbi:Alpha/Beta hydrolase protein [Xylariaceae sp. FL0804]|nr:Alpha/Beta hydrolase protein [Xylariaceae sp. FL0804]